MERCLHRQTDPPAPPTSAQNRRKNERRPLKLKPRLRPHRHARLDNPSPIVRRRHHHCVIMARSLAMLALIRWVISPTSAPNTNRHAPNVGNSVDRSSNNNALAIGRGRTLLLLLKGASRFYGLLFSPLFTIATNSNYSFSCLAGNKHRTGERCRKWFACRSVKCGDGGGGDRSVKSSWDVEGNNNDNVGSAIQQSTGGDGEDRAGGERGDGDSGGNDGGEEG